MFIADSKKEIKGIKRKRSESITSNSDSTYSKTKTKKRGKKSSPASDYTIELKNNCKKRIIIDDETIIQEEELQFTDVTEKLTNSTIYCRDKEQEFIINFLSQSKSKTLFICGQPGTGKTSLLLEMFGNNNIELLNDPKYFKIYMNCMSVNSIDDFYNEMFIFFKNLEINELKPILSDVPNNKNLLRLFNMLGKNKPIVLLDEVDHFYQKNKDIVFYEMLNLPYISDCDVKIIMISNNSEFDKEILPKIEDKKIKVTKYVFTPYTHLEINEILTKKLTQINLLKSFQDDSLRLIAKKCANKTGDIRPALEIIKNLILTYKDDFKDGKKIDLKDVLLIFNKKSTCFIELMNNLTVEQRIVIVSIYFLIMKNESLELSEKEIMEQYRSIKKLNFNNEMNMTDFREIIKSLIDVSIIEQKKNGRFKIKYNKEDIELIFVDDKIFKMFNCNIKK